MFHPLKLHDTHLRNARVISGLTRGLAAVELTNIIPGRTETTRRILGGLALRRLTTP